MYKSGIFRNCKIRFQKNAEKSTENVKKVDNLNPKEELKQKIKEVNKDDNSEEDNNLEILKRVKKGQELIVKNYEIKMQKQHHQKDIIQDQLFSQWKKCRKN